MYRPDTWRRLSRELVLRHLDAYRAHMVEVIASHASRWAELRRWTDEREAASRWWQRQAGNWERLANSREALIQQQRARIAEMEERLRALDDSCKGH
jgi:hypothetical protein